MGKVIVLAGFDTGDDAIVGSSLQSSLLELGINYLIRGILSGIMLMMLNRLLLPGQGI